MQDPILVTGCARSGTSMTAGVIDLCGAWGGKLTGALPHNRRGQFENSVIRNHIIKPYLRSMNCDPLGQKPLPDVNNLTPFPTLRKQVVDVMKTQDYEGGSWYYKGAKMCLMWPIWAEAFPGAKWIIVRRDDEAIINSCLRTGFMRRYNTIDGWQYWIDQHKKRFQEMHEAGLVIREAWPTKMVQGDFTEMQEIIDWLGLRWNDAGVRDFISPALWSEMKRRQKRAESDGTGS